MSCKVILSFYSSCRAPTKKELLQRELGMTDLEFEYYWKFLKGQDDTWLIFSIADNESEGSNNKLQQRW
jgi:hypothetical protein